MIERTYTWLSRLHTFKERFEYLRIDGLVGRETYGFDRFINQRFYHSKEWRSLRDHVIVRDCGCDLGIDGHEIYGRIYIHHMNPIGIKDVELMSKYLLNPEYLISVTHDTHNAIHYGDESLLTTEPIERQKNDTCPWKKQHDL
jgi:hypothetical protein